MARVAVLKGDRKNLVEKSFTKKQAHFGKQVLLLRVDKFCLTGQRDTAQSTEPGQVILFPPPDPQRNLPVQRRNPLPPQENKTHMSQTSCVATRISGCHPFHTGKKAPANAGARKPERRLEGLHLRGPKQRGQLKAQRPEGPRKEALHTTCGGMAEVFVCFSLGLGFS